MADTTEILSGTRDELGSVAVGLANVYERPERPGRLSGLLLPDGEEPQIVAEGDEIALAGQRFRLESIRQHRTGAYLFVFRRLQDAAAPRKSPSLSEARISLQSHAIPAVAPHRLAGSLRDVTPYLLSTLGAKPPELLDWRVESRESWSTQWNGERLGPSTHRDHHARFAGDGRRVEAGVRHEIIRWSEWQVARSDVSGFWRLDDATLSLFAHCDGRGEDEGLVESLSSDALPAAALERIRAGLAG